MLQSEKKIGIYVNGCFHITFENGVTVSSTMGIGTYCDNHGKQSNDIKGDYEYLKNHFKITSNTVEIAIWDINGDYLTKQWKPNEIDDVVGWQSPEELLSALNWASKYKGIGG